MRDDKTDNPAVNASDVEENVNGTTTVDVHTVSVFRDSPNDALGQDDTILLQKEEVKVEFKGSEKIPDLLKITIRTCPFF